MAKLIPFATGDYDLIPVALEDGLIKYPSLIYVEDKKTLVFIGEDGSINEIGSEYEFIQEVETLPNIEDAKAGILYVYSDSVYMLNEDGTELKPLNQNVKYEPITAADIYRMFAE